MALSDAPTRQGPQKKVVKQTKRRTKANPLGWFSDKQKLEAVKTYMLTGNHLMTCRIIGVSDVVLYNWRKSEWWKNAVQEIQSQEHFQLNTRLKSIIEKTFDAVEDRLENGEWIYDQKTGELRRKPVAMKDAHKVTIDLLNKQAELQKQKQQVVDQEHEEDRLLKLAEKFAEMVVNKKRTVDVDVVDVTPNDTTDEKMHQM